MLGWRHVIAIALPLLAALIQWLLWRWIQPFIWFLFFPAVFFSARIGGLKSGLPATLISVVLVWYFFAPPQLSWKIANPNTIYSMIVFLVMGYLFSQTEERLQRTQARLAAALEQANDSAQKVGTLYHQTLELNTLKNQFFANVSHELRTPLTLILSPVERLLHDPGVPDVMRPTLSVIERNARLLYRHVSDLLDIARMEAGRMEMHYTRCDLAALTRQTASHFETAAGDHHITYLSDTPERLEAEIDVEKFQRILLNLLSNAFKFVPDGGEINVALKSDGKAAELVVRDTGPGVPEAQRQLVFERFRQVDGQATRSHGGTGLGLAIVREMAELLRGRVALDEAPGGGARFTLTLPLRAPDGTPLDTEGGNLDPKLAAQAVDELRPLQALPLGTPAAAHQPLILVVEDNPDMTAFIRSILAEDYRVALAANGEAGLESALRLRPDLILSDMMMPGMTGEQLLAQLRTRPELADTPVIIVTARADDALRLRLLQAGVHEYLTKPFSAAELHVRVANLLEERAKTKVTEARLAAIVQSSDDAIIGKTTTGIVTSWNRGAEKIFGYAAAEMLGRSISVLIPPARADEEREILARIARGENVAHFETERVRKDGAVIDVALTISPILDLAGRIVGASKIGRDISARKKAETELKAQRSLLERMSRLAKVGGWAFDVDTMTGTWTDEVARLHDLEQTEFVRVAQGITFYHGSSRARIETAVSEAVTQAKSYDLELEMVTAKGVTKWVRTQGEPVLVDGKVVRVEGAIQDITTRKQAEDEILRLNASLEHRVVERTAELSAANRELDSFAYAVSHDLRAPLRAMSGFSHALVEDYSEQLKGEAREFLGEICEASRKMGELIDGLLTLSRCTRGELQRQTVSISARAHDIAAELMRSEPGRRCVWTIQPNIEVAGDPRMIDIALRNLLGNAWKYTAKRDLANISVGSDAQSSPRWIVVADNGAGFDPAHAARLFQPFQRLHRQDEFPGIGIGLATVQRVIHRHGGTIEAQATPGQGAQFRFWLPDSETEP